MLFSQKHVRLFWKTRTIFQEFTHVFYEKVDGDKIYNYKIDNKPPPFSGSYCFSILFISKGAFDSAGF